MHSATFGRSFPSWLAYKLNSAIVQRSAVQVQRPTHRLVKMQTPSLSRVAALLVLLFSVWTQPATGILEEIATGLEIVIHTVESIQQTWEIVEASDVLKHKNQVANPNIKDLVSKKHHELMDRLVEIYRSIESIEHDVSGLDCT